MYMRDKHADTEKRYTLSNFVAPHKFGNAYFSYRWIYTNNVKYFNRFFAFYFFHFRAL